MNENMDSLNNSERILSLEEMGWSDFFENQIAPQIDASLTPARITEEHRDGYIVQTPNRIETEGAWKAVLPGRFFKEKNPASSLTVGDWVLLKRAHPSELASIEKILKSKTRLVRRSSDRASMRAREQAIAANLDYVFITSSLNENFNLRRIERFLWITRASGAEPVILLTKADLTKNPQEYIEQVHKLEPNIPIHLLSNLNYPHDPASSSLEVLYHYLTFGKTACFIGSSGVGKSTIINRLCGIERQKTLDIRLSDSRGRHATTGRSLIFLSPPKGGMVIDTPGIKEVALWDEAIQLKDTYQDIEELAQNCRFRDCSHQTEPSCAVLQAIKNGELDPNRLVAYHAMQQELLSTQNANPKNYQTRLRKEKMKQIHKAYRSWQKTNPKKK